MKAFFVQIKCALGKSYEVATAIADAEIASEIYSTAGSDLLVKFYLEDGETSGALFPRNCSPSPGSGTPPRLLRSGHFELTETQ